MGPSVAAVPIGIPDIRRESTVLPADTADPLEKCLLTVMVRAVSSGPPSVDEQTTGMNLV